MTEGSSYFLYYYLIRILGIREVFEGYGSQNSHPGDGHLLYGGHADSCSAFGNHVGDFACG